MRPVVLLALTLLLVVGGAPLARAADVPPLPTGVDVDYQLGGAAPVPDNVGIVARDRTASPISGLYNICYVNGFQTQDNQKAFWKKHLDLVLHRKGRPVVDEHWGEFLLDVRTAVKRHALMKIMDRWIDGCASSGFQGVEFDNLDSFTRSHGLITRSEAIVYAGLLVKRAHAAGLAAGQKNLAGWDGTKVGYDFAVAEECARYHECGRYLAHYGDQVIMIEYRDRDFARSCRASYADEVAIVRRDRDLEPSYTPRYC